MLYITHLTTSTNNIPSKQIQIIPKNSMMLKIQIFCQEFLRDDWNWLCSIFTTSKILKIHQSPRHCVLYITQIVKNREKRGTLSVKNRENGKEKIRILFLHHPKIHQRCRKFRKAKNNNFLSKIPDFDLNFYQIYFYSTILQPSLKRIIELTLFFFHVFILISYFVSWSKELCYSTYSKNIVKRIKKYSSKICFKKLK